MKQIEITTKVTCTLKELEKMLQNLDFKIIDEGLIDDIYMCQDISNLNITNIAKYLARSVMIRYITDRNGVYKKLTYKNKTFKDGVTINEEKIQVDFNDVDSAVKLFSALGFDQLVRVVNNYKVYRKGNIEVAVQDVENLGVLIEYENEEDFEGVSCEDVLAEKNKMLKELKDIGIPVTDDFDVKKAYELVSKNL